MATDSVVQNRHLVTLADWRREEVDHVLARAAELKAAFKQEGTSQELAGQSLAMIFHKPSLRTRVSFEVGMNQLGGSALFITDREIGMQSREPVRDVARVLSGYVDAIMIRTFDHQLVRRMAQMATVPVINGLDDRVHPCQILADLLTIREAGLPLDDIAVAYVGDGNNVAQSWINVAALFDLDLRLGVPEAYEPDEQLLAAARQRGAKVTVTHDPVVAVAGAHVVYTDVWASMGQEAEAEVRRQAFQAYQVNDGLMAGTDPQGIVLHCLPAHRGEEITDEVIEGPRSRVFLQAENRLHAQKGLLVTLMGS
jgi:ornithine carbamoyltransferase